MDERTKKIGMEFLIFLFWILLIFGVSFAFVHFSSFTGISEGTFLWTSSAIAQTFGAILGIFIAIAIFRQGKIEELELRRRLAPPPMQIPGLNEEDDEEEEEEEWAGLWPIIYLPAQSMFVLIASAIVCFTLADFFSPKGISIAAIYLMFYSLFCIGLLIYRLSEFFS